MGESTTKLVDPQFDYEDLDETMPLATLNHLLENGDPTSPQQQESADDAGQASILAELARLAELSESIDRRLETIADLLAKPQTLGKPAASASKTSAPASKKASKKTTKKTSKKVSKKTASRSGTTVRSKAG